MDGGSTSPPAPTAALLMPSALPTSLVDVVSFFFESAVRMWRPAGYEVRPRKHRPRRNVPVVMTTWVACISRPICIKRK